MLILPGQQRNFNIADPIRNFPDTLLQGQFRIFQVSQVNKKGTRG
jgi:hypothetical protein